MDLKSASDVPDAKITPEQKISRVMSGIRSTGRLHIGHYFGAIRNWLDLQNQGIECFFGMMDWHGMTTAFKSSSDLPGYARDNAAELLAFGIDPSKCTFFVQSKVPQHLELYMYFSMLVPMGWLERVNTWKDAEEEAKASDTHNLGRFAYPVLQAADIAVYAGSHVPVGADQVPHLELSREIVRRFNHIYGRGTLREPQPLLTSTPVLPGTDGRKMSKSYGNGFLLIQEEKELNHSVKMMVTDPKRVRREDAGDPNVCSVFSFHKLFSSSADQKWAAEGCVTAGIGCGDCKKKLAGNINSFMEKPRERKKQLLQEGSELDSILEQGCLKAQAEAEKTLARVRKATGFLLK